MVDARRYDYDYIVIGSGFGGSVSALRLAEKGYKVCVLEKGRRYSAPNAVGGNPATKAHPYAVTNWNLRSYLWLPALKLFGIQAMSLFKNVLVLGGTGVGGGSLVYANTLLQPGDHFFNAPQWKGLADWRTELLPHYETAKRMLGVTRNPFVSDVDVKLKEVADEMGRGHTFTSVDVGVFFNPGKEGKTVSDPYFGGKGPDRAGCVYCGGCMVGCRYNAKNTLDRNYLYFAEKAGAEIRPETEVYDVRPIGGPDSDGEEGYEVSCRCSTAWLRKDRRILTARGVVAAGGVLGTLALLFRCRDVTKSLPRVSPCLGDGVRTNSEALIGVTTRDARADYSRGIAITSGFYADDVTHIEPVRYPKGSSFMRLLAAPMADAGTHVTRPLKMLWATLRHPLDAARLFFNLKWAENTIILLVMQTVENKMRFRLGRSLFTLFRKRLTTEVLPGEEVPSYIPIGHRVARELAKKVDGIPQSAINEVVLQIPTTAHILGGCGIGADASSGVIDRDHRLFGYRNFYVCDGSAIPANLGVNPSLTITAMAERCMNKISAKP